MHVSFLSWQSKEVGVQLQEDLMKVLNELYTVRETADGRRLFLKKTKKNKSAAKQRENEASEFAPLG